MNPSLISRLRRAGAPLLFVAALCFGVACDHDAPTPQPDPICPEPEQWQPATAGRYEARVRYSCDCRDEAQLVLTAAPAVDDTLRMPAVRRTVYVDKRDLPAQTSRWGARWSFVSAIFASYATIMHSICATTTASNLCVVCNRSAIDGCFSAPVD